VAGGHKGRPYNASLPRAATRQSAGRPYNAFLPRAAIPRLSDPYNGARIDTPYTLRLC